MTKIKYILFFVLCYKLVKSQQNQGTVNYKSILIDTISNSIVQQDSIYMKFIYKPKKVLWENGFLNRPITTTTIINENQLYLIVKEMDSKIAFHKEISDNINFNQLLNYNDTSLRIIKTLLTKNIAGRTCKKIIIKFNTVDAVPIVLWYDDSINCNSIIPGAGNNGKSLKGLILEYELPNAQGKSIITASSIAFGNVSDSVFNPSLTGYQVTELENEEEQECEHH